MDTLVLFPDIPFQVQYIHPLTVKKISCQILSVASVTGITLSHRRRTRPKLYLLWRWPSVTVGLMWCFKGPTVWLHFGTNLKDHNSARVPCRVSWVFIYNHIAITCSFCPILSVFLTFLWVCLPKALTNKLSIREFILRHKDTTLFVPHVYVSIFILNISIYIY